MALRNVIRGSPNAAARGEDEVQLSVVRRFAKPMVDYGLRFAVGGSCRSRMKWWRYRSGFGVRTYAGGGLSTCRGHSGSTSGVVVWGHYAGEPSDSDHAVPTLH